MAGLQVLANSQFNAAAGWTLTASAPATATIANGRLRIVSPSGQSATALQPVLTSPGVWEFLVYVTNITGQGNFGVAVTGPFQAFTSPGLKRFVVTNPGNANFAIGRSTATDFQVEWASARRIDIDMSKVVLTLRDYDGDKKQTSLELGPVTDGTSYTTRQGQAAAIRDAVNAVAGNIANYDFLAISTEPNNANAATPVFQTHVRWIVEMVDSVSGDGPYAFDIPTADLGNADLFLPGSVEHDPDAAEWIALKAAINGIAINPRTGSTFNITRIYLEE